MPYVTSEARRELFLARSLDDMPYAVKSVVAGRLSLTQLEILAHALCRHPEPYAEDEPTLVETISGKSVRESRGEIEYWCQPRTKEKVTTMSLPPCFSLPDLGRSGTSRWRSGPSDPRPRQYRSRSAHERDRP